MIPMSHHTGEICENLVERSQNHQLIKHSLSLLLSSSRLPVLPLSSLGCSQLDVCICASIQAVRSPRMSPCRPLTGSSVRVDKIKNWKELGIDGLLFICKLLLLPSSISYKVSLHYPKCFTQYNFASLSHFVKQLSLCPADWQGNRLRRDRSTQNHMVSFVETGSPSLHLTHSSLCNAVFTIFLFCHVNG